MFRPLRNLLPWSLALAGAASAQDTFKIQRVDKPPRIDGRLDDSAWAGIAPLTGFTQAQPSAGAAPTQRTEVRWVHDGRTLFVALRAFDAQPGGIAARTLKRDGDLIDSDDHFSLVLDPQGSARNGFVFRINALGAQRDGLIFDGASPLMAWDASWDAAAVIDAQGWTAELAIALSVLAAPADGRAWGINIERYTAASAERVRLAGAAADRDVESLADTARLVGLLPEHEGWGLRLRPGVRWAHEQRGDGSRSSKLAPSLDAFYRVTPGITAALTLNTDFSDAEADERSVNLSRFELFRPEKRMFFTQDSGRFAFGGLGGEEPDVLPFFSRRVGLGSALDVGLKLSGSAGPVEFGALGARVERGEGERRARVGVVRAAVGVGADHRVGLIATQGQPQGLPGSSLSGIDYQYRSGNVMGGRTLEANAWLQTSRNTGLGRGHAQGAQFGFPNIGLTGNVSWLRIDDHFLPALGFVQETGVRKSDASIGWWHRTDDGDSVIPSFSAGQRQRLDDSEASRYVSHEWGLSSALGDSLTIAITAERERVANAFELLPGVVAPAKAHRWTAVDVFASASPSRALSGEAALRTGGYCNGRLNEQSASLLWRPNAHWALSGAAGRQDLRLASGRFIARTASLGLEYAGSTRSQQSLRLQYDNVSRQTHASFRAAYRFTPGSELLAALGRVRPAVADSQALETTASIKWSWNWER